MYFPYKEEKFSKSFLHFMKKSDNTGMEVATRKKCHE